MFTTLVGEEAEPSGYIAVIKSPKSTALPKVAIVA